MKINFPSKVREAIYIIVVLGTATLVPLSATVGLPVWLLPLWTSLAGAASALAAFNITPDEDGE